MDHKLHNEHLFYRKNLELQNSKNTHLSNLNTKIDSQGVIISGNTSSDGSGLKHAAHVNANGQLHTTVLNTVNVSPANNLNSGITNDPANSIAVGLRGRSNIADASTETFINCDNTGKLIISNTQNQGMKLEDLSSTLNSEHANHSRSIAVGLRCRTNITDPTSGKFLLCDSNGRLKPHINRDAQAITTDSGGSNLSGSLSDGTATASVDLEQHKHIHFLVSGATNLAVFTVEGSHDNVTFYPVSDIPSSSVGAVSVHLHKIREATYRYYRLKNTQGMGAFTFSNMIFTKLNL